MADEHVTSETLLAHLHGKLSRDDAERLLRHLFDRCPECLRFAEEFAAVHDVPFVDGRLGEIPEKSTGEYLETFERAVAQASDLERQVARDKVRGEGLWSA